MNPDEVRSICPLVLHLDREAVLPKGVDVLWRHLDPGGQPCAPVARTIPALPSSTSIASGLPGSISGKEIP
jgi:hypothetical protein